MTTQLSFALRAIFGALVMLCFIFGISYLIRSSNKKETFKGSMRPANISHKQPILPTTAIPIPSWFDDLYPGLKLYLNQPKCSGVALNPDMVDQLARELIAMKPKTLQDALDIVDKKCKATYSIMLSPTVVTQALNNTTINNENKVLGSVDRTMNDRNPGWGYGHFYAPVVNDNFMTVIPTMPYPLGVIPPGRDVSSSDML